MRRFQIFSLMLLPYLIFGILSMWYGRVVGDEGWYLLAIDNVLKGKMPYADFLYTQTPFLPYFYGTIMSICGPSLVAGRWISFLLGFGAVLMTMTACYRRSGIHGAIIAGLLLSFNLGFVFDVASLRSQALTVFLVAGSICLLSTCGTSWWRAAGCLLFMTLALATRLSMTPALLILSVYLVMVFRKKPAWIAAVLVLDVLSIAAGVWYFYSDGNLLFGIYTFHHEFFRDQTWTIGRAWFFFREAAGNQLPLLVCLAWSVAICIANRTKRVGLISLFKNCDGFLLVLALSYLATSLIHGAQIMPYGAYQTSNIVFAVTFCSIILSRYVSRLPSSAWGYGVLVPLVLLAMPLQQYMIVGSGDGSLRRVEEAVELIRKYSDGKGPILTLSGELVVGSGLPLLAGYEMSEFCNFLDMPDERAAKLKVINTARFRHDIETKAAKILCMTDRDFLMMATKKHIAELAPMLTGQYTLLGEIMGYGQFKQRLFVFAPK